MEERVGCFIDHVRWEAKEEETCGISCTSSMEEGLRWRESSSSPPLSNTPSLQRAVPEAKHRVRKVAMLCVYEADEWQLHTCRIRSNRLDKLTITNRHAAIQGMPAISVEDGRYIAKALLAMRGVNQEIHKVLHEDGRLKLDPRPSAYTGTSHAWMRNLKLQG